ERISSVASRVRSWSVMDVNGIKIGESCGPGAEVGATVGGRGDCAATCTGARLAVFASVRLLVVVTAAAGAEVGVKRHAPTEDPLFWPSTTICPASLRPLASCSVHPEFLGIKLLRSLMLPLPVQIQALCWPPDPLANPTTWPP